ncbi:MAG: glycosyltransferase family 4 protein [Bacteroidetes bacterium]|nr:glycosyltransferase family 4 protein [Bacteroidota bacterium]
MKVKITYDNIIFSLQKAGGISVVWYELLNRVLNDTEIDSQFIEHKSNNIFRNQLNIRTDTILENPYSKFPVSCQRYLNLKLEISGLFHSSYYRTSNSKKSINITTVHDFTYEHFRSGITKNIHSYQKYRAIQNSKKIICISENTKKDLLHLYPHIDENKVAVIYNGVSDNYKVLDVNPTNVLAEFMSFKTKEYAIYVGDRKSEYKNFVLGVEVCKDSKTPLVIVGGGQITSMEQKFLNQKLGKSFYVHFENLLNESLNILYNNALCLLYLSSYEGFGLPIIEAQKAGCPVIALEKSSIPEIIGPVSTMISNKNIPEIVEVIKILKSNNSFFYNQVNIGLNNSQRFSWDKFYKQTKDVYKEINNLYF